MPSKNKFETVERKKHGNYKCYKRLLQNQHLQASDLDDLPFLCYLPKNFKHIYGTQYGDVMLVPNQIGTNMAAGNQRKNMSLTSVLKAIALSLRASI